MSILEQLEAGRIDLLDLGIIGYLSLKAGSAGVAEIHSLYPKFSSRTLLRRLGHLEQIGLVTASKAPGKSGLYAIASCRASVCDTVADANGITGDTATACNSPAADTVDVLDGDVSESRPPEDCPENPDNEAQAAPTQPSAVSSPLEELGVGRLPDRNADFVLLAAITPRIVGESISEWAKRMRCECDRRSIWYPRAVHARVRQAA